MTIVVTGLGILSAAGRGLEATLGALRENRPRLGRLTRFPSPRCGDLPVAEVSDADLLDARTPRTTALAEAAIRDALCSADLTPDASTALCVGTCTGGMPETETALVELSQGGAADPTVWNNHGCAVTTKVLAERFAIRGPALTLSTACASGAAAIAAGEQLISSGRAERAIVGGTDALTRLTLNGFASLLAVDTNGCRPFDLHRSGMSLGEGAAFLVLEREADALARGQEPLAILAGHGNTCDAFHTTAPDPEGKGGRRAIEAALRMASLSPQSVDYVNAHGTGTVENDRAEGRGLRALFGDDIPSTSSTKGIFGHSLGAAGAIEAVVSILALRTGFTPGTAGLTELDPECDIPVLRSGIQSTDNAIAPRVVISSSFGFGGNNSVLCFMRHEGTR